ncbi:hypothetical protein [Lysobacter gummosus]|uniref:hypothetical protein n=1 Tax=Lysobacter gummosus TaxID=262324 RepID=UPI003643FD1A
MLAGQFRGHARPRSNVHAWPPPITNARRAHGAACVFLVTHPGLGGTSGATQLADVLPTSPRNARPSLANGTLAVAL